MKYPEEFSPTALGRLLRSRIPDRHLAHDYESGKNARLDTAYAAMSKTLDAKGLVIMLGNRGTGKTQMAAAYSKEFCCREHNKTRYGLTRSDGTYASPSLYNIPDVVIYTTAMDMLIDLRSHQTDKCKETIAKYTDIPLLIVDEIQVRSETEWERDMLTAVIDKRYGAVKATLLIGNVKPSELVGVLGSSIVDRSNDGGGIINCDWPSFRGS